MASDVQDEKVLGALLMGGHRGARRACAYDRIDRWLSDLVGWAEVDCLCSGVFSEEDLLSDWPGWKALLQRLASDENINKRRAALVLLTGPTRRSQDLKLADTAFALVTRLGQERPILISKAISWLLRSLTAKHPAAVLDYVETHRVELPAVALREVAAKLHSGRKSGPRPGRLSPPTSEQVS